MCEMMVNTMVVHLFSFMSNCVANIAPMTCLLCIQICSLNLGPIVSYMSSGLMPSLRSLLTNMVEQNEFGNVLSIDYHIIYCFILYTAWLWAQSIFCWILRKDVILTTSRGDNKTQCSLIRCAGSYYTILTPIQWYIDILSQSDHQLILYIDIHPQSDHQLIIYIDINPQRDHQLIIVY